jgi:hypothetical protein
MDAITYVLIAFAGISLVTSMIMIGIITYTSVIERTIPDATPKIQVSASNTRVISFFRAPKAFKTPISFVRSMTDV